MAAPSAEAVVGELNERGAICLPSFFDAPFVEDMRGEAITLLSSQISGVKKNELSSGTRLRFDSKVFRDPRFTHLGQAFAVSLVREVAAGYNPKSKASLDTATITYDKKPYKITDVHFDIERSLKFMIYLSDVYKENAAFRYCLGSHRENTKLRNRLLLLGGSLWNLPTIPDASEDFILTDMEGPRGTLIIFDTDGFHSAGSLEQGKERLLIRARTLLSGWYDDHFLRYVARLNPLQFLVPLIVPAGRRTTGGRAMARIEVH